MSDDDPTRTLERRVSAALHAEVDDITPGADSLGPIRGRARAARHRRRVVAGLTAAVAVAALVVSVPTFRDDGSNVSTQRDPASSTSAPTTPSPAPSEAAERALWPDPAGPEQFDDPAAAARSFVAAVFGVADAPLSEVRTTADGEVEIDVLDRSESGATLDTVASTLSLARLDEGRWFVTGARSEDVEIGSPAPGAAAESQLSVSGEGRGYEGTIVVEVRRRAAGAAVVADGFDTAGAGEARAPFSVDLTLPGTNGVAAGAILVAHDSSGAELAVPHLTAQLLWLSGATEQPPASPGPSGGAVTPTTSGDPADGFELGSQPLWPFRTYSEAEDWRATSGEGHQPWHADAVDTASLFTTSYLGFTEIGEITSTDVRADEAWIGVGYRAEAGGTPSTSAVVHLVRFGPHADSPWEVVGTRDTTLTLDTPRYGTRVSSPAPVGGTVTGVDECLVVQVRQPSSGAPLGEAPCVPAGGEDSPWQTTVAWSGASAPALTIVVSTGGHAQGVERFAVTGVPG
jgi:Immunoglobulin-like domain of bacterial spore germination